MFAKLSGRSFQSWTALYEKDRWPVADLKDGIWSLSLFLVFLVCTWVLVENLLHEDGGANPFIQVMTELMLQFILEQHCTSYQAFTFSRVKNCLIHSNKEKQYKPVAI